MLVRVFLKNVVSYYYPTEFNMLINPNRKTHKNHVYQNATIPLLKMAAIYGANGSGKSNLMQSVSFIQDFVLDKEITHKIDIDNIKFKLVKENKDPIEMGLELLIDDILYQYRFGFDQQKVVYEKLTYKENQTKQVVFSIERTSDSSTKTILYNDKKEQIKDTTYTAIIDSWLKSGTANSFFNQDIVWGNIFSTQNRHIKIVRDWIQNKLSIKSAHLITKIAFKELEENSELLEFTKNLINYLDLRLFNIKIKKEIIKKQNEDLKNILQKKGAQQGPYGELFIQDGIAKHRTLESLHQGIDSYEDWIPLQYESLGTKAILKLIPIIKQIIDEPCVYFIDEIENSIHPLLIKGLIKFLSEKETKGQLIFTTHQQILLDQRTLLRPDEIWFAEKVNGSTRLYTLSDYKEHNTLDSAKGYLNGRYGAIPKINL